MLKWLKIKMFLNKMRAKHKRYDFNIMCEGHLARVAKM